MTQILKQKKITAFFLAILMILSVMSSTIGITAMTGSAAESTTLVMIDWFAVKHRGGTLSNGTYFKEGDRVNIFGINGTGEAAYCLEPGEPVNGGTRYTQISDFIKNEVTNSRTDARTKRNLISALIQYGFTVPAEKKVDKLRRPEYFLFPPT